MRPLLATAAKYPSRMVSSGGCAIRSRQQRFVFLNAEKFLGDKAADFGVHRYCVASDFFEYDFV